MRIKTTLKAALITLLLTLCLHADDRLYFLPKDAKKAEKRIEHLIENANKSIEIAMYNFSLNRFAKALAKAHKSGVEVKVFLDDKKTKDDKSEYVYLKDKGIKVVRIKGAKLHTKLALFDRQTVLFGSSNWTKESFDENYEVIYVTSQEEVVKPFIQFLNNLKD